MGEHVANVEPGLHGQPGGTQSPAWRLHWGDKGIDETHAMTVTVQVSLFVDWYNGDEADFKAKIKTWIGNNASATAQVYEDEFADAAWNVVGPTPNP